MMNSGYHQFAEALVFVHGARAETEAAKHAIICAKSGDTETAETWWKVQRAVQTLRPQRAA